MSRAARCVGHTLRFAACSYSNIVPSSLASARVTAGARNYAQTAYKQRDASQRQQEEFKPRRSRESSRTANGSAYDARREQIEEQDGDNVPVSQYSEYKVQPHFSEHLNRLFSPLQFPPELAQRILTHASHRDARRGHNAGLSFIGRRVLSSYLLLFLQSCPELTAEHDFEEIAAHTLHTNLLGEHVGHEWGIGQALVWQPAAPASKLDGERTELAVLRSAGLYKVQGETIQAIMGAIYQQFGASVAHRVFHTRLLPLLRIKGGLPPVFYPHLERVVKKMGGENGPLLKDGAKVESSVA